MPDIWNVAEVMSFSMEGEQSRTDNYRSNKLPSAAYKFYARILNNRIKVMSCQKRYLSEEQHGFMKGKSTTDRIFYNEANCRKVTRMLLANVLSPP